MELMFLKDTVVIAIVISFTLTSPLSGYAGYHYYGYDYSNSRRELYY
jgi:hypothetical protein